MPLDINLKIYFLFFFSLTSLAYKEIGTIFDQDKDGRLSRDELMHITYEGEPLFSEETVDKDIDLLDFNGDGYISFESKDSSKK